MNSTVTETKYVIAICSPIAIGLHTVGLWLLTKAKSSKLDVTERMILTNLCITEILANVTLFVNGILRFTFPKAQKNYLFGPLRTFLMSYYFSTLYLTWDRFLKIYWNIKYNLLWSVKKTIFTLTVLWIFSILGGILQYYLSPLALGIIDLTLDAFLVVVSVFVYGYAMKLSQKILKNSHLSKSTKLIPKGYLLSALIVSSYVLLTAIPHSIFFFILLHRKNFKKNIYLLLDIALALAFWSDAIIYIYFSKNIRELFQMSLRCLVRKKSTIKINLLNKNQTTMNFTEPS